MTTEDNLETASLKHWNSTKEYFGEERTHGMFLNHLKRIMNYGQTEWPERPEVQARMLARYGRVAQKLLSAEEQKALLALADSLDNTPPLVNKAVHLVFQSPVNEEALYQAMEELLDEKREERRLADEDLDRRLSAEKS